MKNHKIIEDVWKARHPYDVLFLELIEGYEIKVIKKDSSDIKIYNKNKNILIINKPDQGISWVKNDLIWDVFKNKILDDYNKIVEDYITIQEILKEMLKIHMGIEETVPVYMNDSMLEQFKLMINIKM